MRIQRLMRRPPPRIYAQKQIEDIRIPPSSNATLQPSLMNSVELVDTLAIYAGRVGFPRVTKETLVESPRELVPPIIGRAFELFPLMDPVLIVRFFSYLQSMDYVSASQYQELLNACVPRLGDLSIQQLVRLMFSVCVVARRLTLDTGNFTESCFGFIKLDELSASTPPRLVAKLVVSTAILANSKQAEQSLPMIEALVERKISHLQPDQVQQVAFGLGRLATKNAGLVNRITDHSVSITPIRDQKTYCSLLISLHRLNPSAQSWEAFKKIFRDHIGLAPSEPPHVSNLANLFPGQSDILLRRIRNALVY